MNPGHPANQRVILKINMPANAGHGDDDVIAHHDVVADMAAGQDVVVVPDDCRLAVPGGAVDGNALPDRVVIADLRAGDSPFPFQVLRLEPDAREGEHLVAFTQPRMAVNHHVRMEAAAGAELDVLADDAVGPDLAAVANLGLGMDDCRWMEHSLFLFRIPAPLGRGSRCGATERPTA